MIKQLSSDSTTSRLATASSEAQVLRASGEDARAQIERLREELDGKESRLAEAAAEEGRLREELAASESRKVAVEADLADLQAAMDTGAADFVALEAKLCEAEATCERLRSGVQSTEMEMAEVCVCVCGAFEEQSVVEGIKTKPCRFRSRQGIREGDCLETRTESTLCIADS